MNPPICIIAALKEELAGIKRQMEIVESTRLGPNGVVSGRWQGHSILLVCSGIGKKRAGEALSRAYERFKFSRVISIGYAGGLAPHLAIGDLVLGDAVLDYQPDESSRAKDSPRIINSKLLNEAVSLSKSLDIPVYQGGLLTVERAISDSKEKRELGERLPILAVEMETSSLARFAEEKHLDFLPLRAISDTVDHDLLNISPFLDKASGEVSKIKAGWYVLTHPGSLNDLKELGRHSRKATSRLTDFLERLLQRLKLT